MTDLMFRIRHPASPCFLREIFIAPFPFTVSIFLTRESIKSGRHMWLGKKAPNIFVIPAAINVSLTLESRCPRRSPPTARHSSTPKATRRDSAVINIASFPNTIPLTLYLILPSVHAVVR